jgi:cbb3-type cytochrome oxidase subunit 1
MERIRPRSVTQSAGLIHTWAAFIKVFLYIMIPTVAGIVVGISLDAPDTVFWTILLMAIGLVVGTVLAWFTIRIEMRHQERHKE